MSELLAVLVSEYRQDGMPDVPLPQGVDLVKLTAGDEKPMFVTLPILEVGGKSDKGFTWGESDVDRVVSEINTKRPEGNFGHVKPDERSHKYDLGRVRWIGATKIGTKAYAKAYVPRYAEDAREYFRVAEATGARVGTSVYGRRGKRGLSDMVLESLDFGHPDRLGFEGAAVVPRITSEFKGEGRMGDGESNDDLIVELRQDRSTLRALVSELKLTGDDPLDAAKALVSELADLRKGKDRLDALVSEFGLKSDDVIAEAKALVTELATHRRKALVGSIDELIAETFKEAPEQLHKVVREFLVDEDGVPVVSTKDEAKTRIEGLKENETIKALSKALVNESRGPRAFVGNGSNNNGDDRDWRDKAAEAGYAKARQMGIKVNGGNS